MQARTSKAECKQTQTPPPPHKALGHKTFRERPEGGGCGGGAEAEGMGGGGDGII